MQVMAVIGKKNYAHFSLIISNFFNFLHFSYRMADPSPYYNPLATDSYLPSYDNETSSRAYCFASPLYSTTWSPPPNDGSRSNSLQNTPVHGSVRSAENDENTWRSHVYTCPGDDYSPEGGKLSSRSVEDYSMSPVNSPHNNHVYSAVEPGDDKDNSRSPIYSEQGAIIAEQQVIATLPEQNGHLDEESGSASPQVHH